MDEDAHRKELLDLGFPPEVVEEGIRARALGLFEITLSPEEIEEAVKRIMERIIPLLPAPKPAPWHRRFRVIPRTSRQFRKV